jgi:hypothetical protein
MAPEAGLARVLDALEPAETALRDWVRSRFNDSIVRELAELDHGMLVEEYRQGIEELLVARRLPGAALPDARVAAAVRRGAGAR